MELNWTGPYYIVAAGLNDTYYLMTPDGRRLDTPISKDQLSPFLAEDISVAASDSASVEGGLGV